MAYWRLQRVVLLCLGWLLGAPLLALTIRAVSASVEWRDPEMVAVDVIQWVIRGGAVGRPFFAALLIPPVALVAAWLVARWHRGAGVSSGNRGPAV